MIVDYLSIKCIAHRMGSKTDHCREAEVSHIALWTSLIRCSRFVSIISRPYSVSMPLLGVQRVTCGKLLSLLPKATDISANLHNKVTKSED